MPNYPDITKDNCYLMSRYDGCVLDAKDFNTDIQVLSVWHYVDDGVINFSVSLLCVLTDVVLGCHHSGSACLNGKFR